jgi:hypothetical protein
MKRITLFTFALLITIGVQAYADAIDSLASRISKLNSQIAVATKQLEQEKKTNQDLVSRSSDSDEAMKKAYASAEKLNQLNANLNQLQEQQNRLCEEWRLAYAKTVDSLLLQASSEGNPKKRGQIGEKLRELQEQNQKICPDQRKSAVSQEWRSIRAESYDGPQEIQQKIQLLKDISREMNIQVAQLDQQMQNFQKEKKTKERAEEFIQESTLFTDNLAIGRTGRTIETSTTDPLVGTPATGTTPEVLNHTELSGKEQIEQFELQYKQKKKDLQTQQQDIQQKITELEQRASQLQIP